MARIRVLDPTAPPPQVSVDPGPDAGLLSGKTIGIRYDLTWQSFLRVSKNWARRFEASGATIRWWCAGGRVGEEGERTRCELGEFVEDVDVALVGLGN